MPNDLPQGAIEEAEAAVAFAQQVRTYHRRRVSKTSRQRAADIEHAITRLREAMAPLKSAIGAFQYGPQTTVAEANRQAIREASLAIQKERRKLWKMRGPNPQPEGTNE